MRYKVLVIEDDKVDQMAFKRFVMDENPPYDYDIAGSVSEAKRILDSQRFDIVITDYLLGDGTALDMFNFIKDIPIVIVTGSGNEKVAVEAMKAGACDYLIKDPERNYFKVLPITAENAINHKKLEKQFSLLSHALTSVNDSVYVTDMDDKIIFVNKAFCQTYGYREEDIVDSNINIIGESGWRGEFYHRRKDGIEFSVSLSKSIIKDKNGKEIAIVGVARDITERKRVEEVLRQSEEQYRLITENSHDLICVIDLNGTFTYVTPSFKRALEYSLEELLGTNAFSLIHPEDLDSVMKAFQEALVNKTVGKAEFRYKDRKGVWHIFESVGNWILDKYGNPQSAVIVSRDITERKRAEEALEQVNEKLKNWISELEQRNRQTALLNEMGDLLQTCLTVEEAYTVIAKSAQQLFSAESGALYMLNASEDLVEAAAVWGKPLPDEGVFTPDECWALRRGHVYVVDDPGSELICKHLSHPPSAGYLCVPLMAQGKSLGMLHLQNENDMNGMKQSDEMWGRLKGSTKQQLAVAVAEHIALALANLKLRETLHNQAIRDPLTGLFNRRYMEESLKREVHRAERKGISLGVIMLDIDHFKQFNDTFGHAAGDVLLHELGSLLQVRIRKADIACRYGGEEFILILPETSPDDTRQRAEQLREEFKHLNLQYDGRSIKAATLSLGVAVFPEHGSTAEAISRAADLALFQAKREGRDRVVVGQPVVDSERLFPPDVASRRTA